MRIPRSVEALKYELKLIPKIKEAKTKGELTLTIKVLEDTPYVLMHMSKIEVLSFSIKAKDSDWLPGACKFNEDYISQTYSFSFDDASLFFKKGNQYLLFIKYEGVILDGRVKGLYSCVDPRSVD